MRRTDTRGLSSRAVLVALAIVAVGTVIALLSLADSGSRPKPETPAIDAPTSKGDAVPHLAPAEGSGAQRADVPQQPEARTPTLAGRTRTLVVSGTVIEAKSRTVLPEIEIAGSASSPELSLVVRATTTSNAEGRYSLQLVVPLEPPFESGPWSLLLTTQGYRFVGAHVRLEPSDFRPDPRVERTLVAERNFELEIDLALHGRVLRESDRSPIAGAGVELLRLAQPPSPLLDTTTDGTGRFRFEVTSETLGEVALLVTAEGHRAKFVPTNFDPAHAVDVGDIFLEEGVCLEGFVTTANGSNPAATRIHASTNARDDVYMFAKSGAWAIRNGAVVARDAWAPVESDGHFRMCGLAPDEYFVSVSYLGCATGSNLETVEVKAPDSSVRIQLSRVVYRLRVLDARTGEAISRARFLFDGTQEFACNIQEDYVIATDPGIESPGRVVAEGYRALRCTLPALTASESRDLEFRLEPLPRQVTCTIVVTSPAGTPVEDVEIEIRGKTSEADGQGPMGRISHTAPDGRHQLPALVPGAYQLEIGPYREGNPSVQLWLDTAIELDVREGMKPVEIRLEEGGSVQATVATQGGESVDARTWLVRSPGSEPEQVDWRNNAGSFLGWIPKQSAAWLAKPLPVGAWTLRFEANGCESQDIVVNVVAGTTTTIAVVLEPKPPR